MQYLKNVGYVVVVALALYGVYALVPKSNTVVNTPSDSTDDKKDVVTTPSTTKTTTPTPTVPLIDNSLVEVKTYKTPDTYTTFDVSYPQFKNVDAAFNKKIVTMVNAGIDQQKSDAKENWKARYDSRAPGENITQYPTGKDKFSYSVTWTPTQINKNYVSALMVISGYAGGAHGFQNMVSFNYDVAQKEEVVLADLFPNDSNYLKTVSDFSRKSLEAQFRKKLNVKTKDDETNFKNSILPMLMDGTIPEKGNFNIFTFTPEEIAFHFTEYQVAPYVLGDSSVIFPRK